MTTRSRCVFLLRREPDKLCQRSEEAVLPPADVRAHGEACTLREGMPSKVELQICAGRSCAVVSSACTPCPHGKLACMT